MHDTPTALIYVGPDKCGSTTLFDLGRAHDDISTPHVKELYFFDRFHARGMQWYLSQFDRRKAALLDVSHDYLFDAQACQRIAESGLDYRLIVGLRSPYRRAVSAYKYMWYQGRLRVPFDEALRSVDELLGHGDYGTLLRQWIDVHETDRWIPLDFDAMVSDQAAWQRDFFARIGVAPANVVLTHSNPARAPVLPAPAMRLARRAGWVLRQLKAERAVQAGKDWIARSNVRAGSLPVVPPADTLSVDVQRRIVNLIERAAEPIHDVFGFDPTPAWLADFGRQPVDGRVAVQRGVAAGTPSRELIKTTTAG